MPIFSNRRFRHRHQDSGTNPNSQLHQVLFILDLVQRARTLTCLLLLSLQTTPTIISLPWIQTIQTKPTGCAELDDMDADDVSYRLRLLMQNNYYLPPAHLKPFDYSPVSESPKKPAKSSPSPSTFLDIFKVGKLRSNPKAGKGPWAYFANNGR